MSLSEAETALKHVSFCADLAARLRKGAGQARREQARVGGGEASGRRRRWRRRTTEELAAAPVTRPEQRGTTKQA